MRWILCVLAVVIIMIISEYLMIGFGGNKGILAMFDIYNGPLGRTLFTQAGTLCYHFDLFPDVFAFLNGRSLSGFFVALLLGDTSYSIRSARLVMEYYGSEKVYDGTGGVMNTVFLGEAYANFGYVGAVLSIVWVACIISLVFAVIIKMEKTPIAVVFAAVMTVIIASATQGGLFDFIYSFGIIFTAVFLLGLNYYHEIFTYISKKVFRVKSKQ